MTTLVLLFPPLKRRFGDGPCLAAACLGRGCGMLLIGAASAGGRCPACGARGLREALLVLGGTRQTRAVGPFCGALS
jgi:hypothetical protein